VIYVSISRNWIFSRGAQRVYFVCVLLDLALLATRIGIIAAMAVAEVSKLPPVTLLIVRVLLFPEVVGSAVLLVGMSYCWFGFHRARSRKRVLWYVLVSLFTLLTMPIYYFFVYRRLASEETVLASKSAIPSV
jgi:hypothetical protein